MSPHPVADETSLANLLIQLAFQRGRMSSAQVSNGGIWDMFGESLRKMWRSNLALGQAHSVGLVKTATSRWDRSVHQVCGAFHLGRHLCEH